jgi:hypothetical protein
LRCYSPAQRRTPENIKLRADKKKESRRTRVGCESFGGAILPGVKAVSAKTSLIFFVDCALPTNTKHIIRSSRPANPLRSVVLLTSLNTR